MLVVVINKRESNGERTVSDGQTNGESPNGRSPRSDQLR